MKISLIIIGYNTLNTLKSVLDSVNQIKYNNECEVVYVDDASTDESLNYFSNFNLQFDKKVFSFSKNRGRVVARQKAIELSSGDWLCFIQSNVIPDRFLLFEYARLIEETDAVAFAGQIDYKSDDAVFENYLNRQKRGLNLYQHKEKIHFRNLLFGNCMIKKSVFNKVPLNTKFIKYGGSELDFAFRLLKQLPGKTVANKNSVVTRINHSGFKQHCDKLVEYGEINFSNLTEELKLEVVKLPVLLYKFILFKALCSLLLIICFRGYKIRVLQFDVFCIRLGLLCSILKGYYRAK